MAKIENIKVGNTTYQILGGGNISYSTTEQDTGMTWIDGKKIYQKTLSFTMPTTSADATETTVYIDMGVQVAEYILIRGTYTNDNGQHVFPSIYSRGGYVRIFGYINSSSTAYKNKVAVINAWTSANGKSGYVTVQYTKV